MRAPEPTITEGLIYLVISCLILMAIANGSHVSQLPGPEFKVASR